MAPMPDTDLGNFKPICICVPSATLTRYVIFESSYEGLRVPPYSSTYRIVSASPAKNKNDAIRLAGPECTHFFFIDDDHHFDFELVKRLLLWQVPVVCAVTALAQPPFHPVLFKGETFVEGQDWDVVIGELVALADKYRGLADEDTSRSHLNRDLSRVRALLGKKRYENISWGELDGQSGLVPVFAGAGAGLMVRRDVLDKIGEPWFEVGRYDPEQLQEDCVFYEKCRDLGIPIYADAASPMGHITPVVTWPVRREDGRWTLQLMWQNGQKIRLGRSDVDTPGTINQRGMPVEDGRPRVALRPGV